MCVCVHGKFPRGKMYEWGRWVEHDIEYVRIMRDCKPSSGRLAWGHAVAVENSESSRCYCGRGRAGGRLVAKRWPGFSPLQSRTNDEVHKAKITGDDPSLVWTMSVAYFVV